MESLGVEQKLYKLTSIKFITYNYTKWGENVTHYAPGNGSMCTNGWLHAYENPYLAILMDPAHGNFGKSAVLWESSGIVGISDGLKVGCSKLTTIKIIDKPEISIEFRITFAIKSSLKVYHEKNYVVWANNWLNGIDRSARAATNAANATNATNATYAANAAANAANAASAAAYAADAAANAAAKINFIEIIEEILKETSNEQTIK